MVLRLGQATQRSIELLLQLINAGSLLTMVAQRLQERLGPRPAKSLIFLGPERSCAVVHAPTRNLSTTKQYVTLGIGAGTVSRCSVSCSSALAL
jgi:hypothetical protein